MGCGFLSACLVFFMPDMVGKYIDIILDFVQSEAGQQTMALVKNALL
jgi:hypothetical protein